MVSIDLTHYRVIAQRDQLGIKEFVIDQISALLGHDSSPENQTDC